MIYLFVSQAGSECNSSTLTFDGVDLMGERLAEEVIMFVKAFNFHPVCV